MKAMPQIQLTAENVCSYRINGPDGFFGLRESTLDTGAKAARITLLKKLDRKRAKPENTAGTLLNANNLKRCRFRASSYLRSC